MFSRRRRVRVDVDPSPTPSEVIRRPAIVALTRDDPARIVELVAQVADGNDVEHEDVLRLDIESRHLQLQRRKHSPHKIDTYIIKRLSKENIGMKHKN